MPEKCVLWAHLSLDIILQAWTSTSLYVKCGCGLLSLGKQLLQTNLSGLHTISANIPRFQLENICVKYIRTDNQDGEDFKFYMPFCCVPVVSI